MLGGEGAAGAEGFRRQGAKVEVEEGSYEGGAENKVRGKGIIGISKKGGKGIKDVETLAKEKRQRSVFLRVREEG